MLKAGDLVKYHKEDEVLNQMGFVLGQLYVVTEREFKGLPFLDVETLQGEPLALIDTKGELTAAADHFTLVRPEVRLPIGKANIWRLA